MKNIDKELIQWSVDRIKKEFPEDIDLLIGQVGGCKTPDDEQKLSIDFFVPATERGYQLAKTFIIEDMGYDLYPISWERLQGIIDINEPRMIFAIMKGEVIYARDESIKERYEDLKRQLLKKLEDENITFVKALEFLNTAMEIYQTMMFEDNLCAARKATGGIVCYLSNAIAMVNGQYLRNGYGKLTEEFSRMKIMPEGFQDVYNEIFHAKTIKSLQNISHQMIELTRDMFIEKKPKEEKKDPEKINYDDMADWYQEARYTFRRIEYYAKHNALEECYLWGCYIQIEFDAIKDEFQLETLDLMGAFNDENLEGFVVRAKALEKYITDVLETNHAAVKIYDNLDEFLASN